MNEIFSNVIYRNSLIAIVSGIFGIYLFLTREKVAEEKKDDFKKVYFIFFNIYIYLI